MRNKNQAISRHRCGICHELLDRDQKPALYMMGDRPRAVHRVCRKKHINEERRATLAKLAALETHAPDSSEPPLPTLEQCETIAFHPDEGREERRRYRRTRKP